MRRMRESQESKNEERTGQQRDEPKPTDVRVPQSNQDSEDIGGDIDIEKWEKFRRSKRSAEGGEESQSKRKQSQESRRGNKRSREEEEAT
eukprot:6550258-Karenia_brevis.AAC.1